MTDFFLCRFSWLVTRGGGHVLSLSWTCSFPVKALESRNNWWICTTSPGFCSLVLTVSWLRFLFLLVRMQTDTMFSRSKEGTADMMDWAARKHFSPSPLPHCTTYG